MKVTIEIDGEVVDSADALEVSVEDWIQQAIADKLKLHSVPTESEEAKIVILAKIFKVYKSPPNIKLEFDEEASALLMDLSARGLVDLQASGFIRTNTSNLFCSGPVDPPLTLRVFNISSRQRLNDSLIGHPTSCSRRFDLGSESA